MTSTLQFFNSLWAFLPGLVPYVAVVWVLAIAIAAGRLAVDEYNGDQRPVLSMLPLSLWVGGMMTLLVVLGEAGDKGLIPKNMSVGQIIGSLAVSISLLRGRNARKQKPA